MFKNLLNTKPFTGQRFAGQTQSEHKQTQENEKESLKAKFNVHFANL